MADTRFTFRVAGDVDRDGQHIEVRDEQEQVANLFCAYRSNEMTFWSGAELPLSVIEKMIGIAISEKPSANKYQFSLLRKEEP